MFRGIPEGADRAYAVETLLHAVANVLPELCMGAPLIGHSSGSGLSALSERRSHRARPHRLEWTRARSCADDCAARIPLPHGRGQTKLFHGIGFQPKARARHEMAATGFPPSPQHAPVSGIKFRTSTRASRVHHGEQTKLSSGGQPEGHRVTMHSARSCHL
jgi:hypothetical protein